jgi:hypothetical protein
MNRLDIVYFASMLFLALVALLEWKRRRYQTTARISRGLHSYVSADTDSCRACDPASV